MKKIVNIEHDIPTLTPSTKTSSVEKQIEWRNMVAQKQTYYFVAEAKKKVCAIIAIRANGIHSLQ